jgi:hypothetical protein
VNGGHPRTPVISPVNDSLVRLRSALAGRYVIEREVGLGGMARVYLADLRHNRKVAIKVLKPELAEQLGPSGSCGRSRRVRA